MAHRPTDRADDGSGTDRPTDTDRPDPTDPDETVWDVPTDTPDRFQGKLIADSIGGGVMVYERGTDPHPTDPDGPPWIAVSQGDVIGREDWR